jgi:CHASE2 domain-containing sensor protein
MVYSGEIDEPHPVDENSELRNSQMTFWGRGKGAFRLLKERWRKFEPTTRHWLVNILIGVCIESALLIGAAFHLQYLVSAQNAALDKMMLLHAGLQFDPPAGRTAPRQVFVAIDESLYRTVGWGGGEPYRAPREPLLRLVDLAFANGAEQVVLDVVIEGDGLGRAHEAEEDRKFAQGLSDLMRKPYFAVGRQLVLVRTLRDPLMQVVLDPTSPASEHAVRFPALSELRRSSWVDSLIESPENQGRIVIAAPYFKYSEDRVLRDWQLLQVVCQRVKGSDVGIVQVVPSVQIRVVARFFGLSYKDYPMVKAERCTSFPEQALESPPLKEDLAKQMTQVDVMQKRIAVDYWSAMRGAILKTATSKSSHDPMARDIGSLRHTSLQLSNRVIFRSRGTSGLSDKNIRTIAAQDLLRDPIPQSTFAGQIVTIGQSHRDTGDIHETPLGQMPGAMVVVNAIDSMARYPLISPPSPWITLTMALAFIVGVGFIFARWDSMRGTLIATAVAIGVLAVGSFYLFAHGVWLDFALPLLGIQAHRLVKSFEERVESRHAFGSDSHQKPEDSKIQTEASSDRAQNES